MIKRLVLQGRNIHGIASFYDEINRVFMADVGWTLAASLDALDDMLYGGYGALDGAEPVTLVWRDLAHSRDALGRDATLQFYRAKRRDPRFRAATVERKLAALEAGVGETYFDIVMAIFASHPNIELVAG